MEDQKIKKPKDPKYNNSVEYNKIYYAKKRTEILSSLKTKCLQYNNSYSRSESIKK